VIRLYPRAACCCCSLLQLRACSHLGLRLRDQLLAFASVCPVRLTSGQLTGLGAAFRQLTSLSLCGKVAIDGAALVELTQGLQGLSVQQSCTAAAAAAAECSSGGKVTEGLQGGQAVAGASGGAGLLCLSLDCHFVAVSPEQMQTALQHLSGLKVRKAKHRTAKNGLRIFESCALHLLLAQLHLQRQDSSIRPVGLFMHMTYPLSAPPMHVALPDECDVHHFCACTHLLPCGIP
jgi:hypothetical protein